MTITQAVTRLLRFFSPEERSIPSSVTYPGRCEDCLDALNDAFTEMVELSDEFLRRSNRGKLLNDPAAVSLTLTRGSTTASVVAASYATWFPGCSVVIEGTEIDNEILEASVNGGNYDLTLRYPYDGTTGAHNATVYHDAITLAGGEVELIEPVEIFGLRELVQVSDASQLSVARSDEDYGLRTRRHVATSIRRSDYTDAPAVFWMEDHVPSSTSSEMVRRLRIFPFVRETCTLSYGARIAQPYYSAVDTTVIPLSDRHASSILLPIAAKRLMASEFFQHGQKNAQVESGYQAALAIIPRTNPRPKTGPTFRPSA
jgi:hypothetical protein